MNMLTTKEVRLKYGISRNSLIEHEQNGDIVPERTPNGHRRYNEDEIKLLLDKNEDNSIFMKICKTNCGKLPMELKIVTIEKDFYQKGQLILGHENLSDVKELMNCDEGVDKKFIMGYYKRLELERFSSGWKVHDIEARKKLQNISMSVYFNHDKNEDTGISIFSNDKKYEIIDDVIFLPDIIHSMNLSYFKIYESNKKYNIADKKCFYLNFDLPKFVIGEEVFDGLDVYPVVYKLQDVTTNIPDKFTRSRHYFEGVR